VDSTDVTAEFTVTQELQGGISPAGPTITVKVTAAGFFDTGGLGRHGQSFEPLTAEHVADVLKQSFDASDLRMILDHVVRLREVL
jgi:hypothetical protein